jgi:hypothetical protein
MTINLVILAALAVIGVVGSFLTVARDGYQRIPTRRY